QAVYAYRPAVLSATGRFDDFASNANNLVPNDTNGFARDVFVRDRRRGTTTRVSVHPNGDQGHAPSCVQSAPSVSGDGAFVAFDSLARLAPGDGNTRLAVYLRGPLA